MRLPALIANEISENHCSAAYLGELLQQYDVPLYTNTHHCLRMGHQQQSVMSESLHTIRDRSHNNDFVGTRPGLPPGYISLVVTATTRVIDTRLVKRICLPSASGTTQLYL